jgi:hypothetical protein
MTKLTAHALAGTITFAVGGAPAETQALSAGPLIPPGPCDVENIVTTLTPQTRAPNPTSSGVNVNCQVTGGYLTVTMEMPDERQLGVGTYAIPAQNAGILVANTACTSASSDDTATLVITRAEGGSSPYPAAVTPDYVREFSVHIELEAPQTTVPNGCMTPPASVTVDLQFAESAADVVNHPDARCPCG